MVTSHPVSGWHILRISNNFISYAPKSLHYTHAGQAGVWILYNTNVRMAVTFHGRAATWTSVLSGGKCARRSPARGAALARRSGLRYVVRRSEPSEPMERVRAGPGVPRVQRLGTSLFYCSLVSDSVERARGSADVALK